MDPNTANPPVPNPVPDPNTPATPPPDASAAAVTPSVSTGPVAAMPSVASTGVDMPAEPVAPVAPAEAPAGPILSPLDSPNSLGTAPTGSSFGDQSMPAAHLAADPVAPAATETQNIGGFTPAPLQNEPSFSPTPEAQLSAAPAEPQPVPAPDLGSQSDLSQSLGAPAFSPEAASPAQPAVPVPEMSGMPDSTPTDLSHLAYNGGGEPAVAQAPESVAVPQATVEVGAVSAGSGSKGFPKWILIVGVVIVLIVAVASAYFILGVGRSIPETSSVPIEQQPLANPPEQIIPTQPAPPAATASAGFGSLQGANGSAQEGTSASKPASALELLRQRQGQ